MADMLPVALDAMGGDKAPEEIVAGAHRAVDELGVPVVLVGQPEVLGPLAGDLEIIPASEVIAHERRPRLERAQDEGLVAGASRRGRPRRQGLRDGLGRQHRRHDGVGAAADGPHQGGGPPGHRDADPVPGHGPTILLDAGANAECQPEWLVQFAQMGAVFARTRYGIEPPRVGLLSIGEEPSKGTPLVKETHALLAAPRRCAAGGTFVGNVEGRDVMTPDVDVVVTDGFTGNVVLKTLEGGMRALVGAIFGAFGTSAETQAASEVLMPALMPLYATLDPDNTGGAMLLGVDGLCLISHGSSSATAIVNAVRVAKELHDAEVVDSLRAAVAECGSRQKIFSGVSGVDQVGCGDGAPVFCVASWRGGMAVNVGQGFRRFRRLSRRSRL